jgi:hypothetical protein
MRIHFTDAPYIYDPNMKQTVHNKTGFCSIDLYTVSWNSVRLSDAERLKISTNDLNVEEPRQNNHVHIQ